MNIGDIAELFIRAAETERKLPPLKGTRETTGGYVLPWVHDLGDINSRRRTGERKESLRPGHDPLRDWENEWLLDWERRATKAQIGEWESCLRIGNEFVADVGQRRALWAWSFAKAGGANFAKWCRREGIAELTGHRRKNRALIEILHQLGGKPDLHDGNGQSGVLPCTPENGHVFVTVEGGRTVHHNQPVYIARPNSEAWRDDPSFRTDGMIPLAEVRAIRRRQQEAAKRKQARAA